MTLSHVACRQRKEPASRTLTGSGWWPLSVLLLFLSFWQIDPAMAEGTRQLAPSPDDITMLLTSREDFSNFAAFDGPADSRLYITIADPGEMVYLGLATEFTEQGNPVNSFLNSRYRFRIKRVNPGGADPVVHGPFTVDNATANVSGWADAVFGAYDTGLQQPNPAKGNQMDYVYRFQPAEAGDYYIEFDDVGIDGDPKVLIGYWDITVALNETPVRGRVWSRNWALRTPVEDGTNPQECGWDRKFNGTLFSYTADGFVSKIDFTDSGFQGLAFTVAFNMTGPGNSGNFAEDRQSIEGVNATGNAAQHKIFLHEPDPLVFPDGECGTVTGPGTISCNGEDDYCLDVTVSRPGQVDIILDFNQNGQFDPESEDVILVHCFADGESLNYCVPWDGTKGDGSPIGFGDQVDIVYVYTQGVQNWAVYDGEFMKNGFCVEAVRPLCGDMSLTNVLYWDDRNISEAPGTGQPLDGRAGAQCRTEEARTWTNFEPNQSCTTLNDALTTGYGDKNTLNTWWFASVTKKISKQVPILTCRIEGENVICEGGSTEFMVDVSSNSNMLSSHWEGPNGFVANGPTTGPISVAGTYCVTVTDEFGCETTCCQQLTVNDKPVLGFSIVQPSCFGEADGSISASATGGTAPYQYSLDGGAFQNNGTFDGLGQGSYTLTVEDSEGCSISTTIKVDQPALLTCSISDVLPVTCHGAGDGSATVSAEGGTGPYDFSWDTGATTATAEGLTAGKHEVTVTDKNGCSTTCSVTIEAPDALVCTIEKIKAIRCAGDKNGRATVVVTGGNGSYTFEWDNGETTATATSLSAGMHSVTVTDTKGCQTICTAEIPDTPPLACEIVDVQPINCLGESSGRAIAAATGGNGSYNYKWDNGETGAEASALSAGTHTVTITDGKGCTTTCNVDIPAPLENLSCKVTAKMPVGCQSAENGSAMVEAAGGNGGYTYLWDNGETTATASMLSVGKHSVTVTDQTGCSTTCSVEIGQAAELSCYTKLIRDVTCKGNSNGMAEVFAVGGVAPYAYEWDSGETTKVAEHLNPGIHEVIITDAIGCTTTCTIRISDSYKNFECWTMLMNDATCEGGSDGVVWVNPSGGVEPYSYHWNTGDTTRILEGLNAGSYTVTVTDAEGCVSVCGLDVLEPKVQLLCPEPLEVSCADPERDQKINAWLKSVGVENACEENPVVENDYQLSNFSGNCIAEQTVTFSYEVSNGRTATCQALITLVHEEAPAMICPPDVTITCTEGLPEADFAGGQIISGCGLEYDLDVQWTGDEVSGGPAGNGELETIVRTYSATDNCGNTVTCSQTIKITADTEPPVITKKGPLAGLANGTVVTVEADFGNPDWDPTPYTADMITGTDPNGPVTVTLSEKLLEDLDQCNGQGYLQRYRLRWKATDACGIKTTFTLFVHVIDTTPPVLSNTPAEAISTTCDAIPAVPELEATDNGYVSEIRYEREYLDPICEPEYRIARIWTPVDACGNEGEPFTQVITVSRSNATPEFYFPSPLLQDLENNDTYVTDCAGFEQLISSDDLIAANSICGGQLTIGLNYKKTGPTNCPGQSYTTYEVQWIAKDECGWNNTFNLKVQVVDQQAPQLFFEQPEYAGFTDGDTVSLSCSRLSALRQDAGLITVADDCDNDPDVAVKAVELAVPQPCSSGEVSPSYKLIWRATDRCDNSSTFTLYARLIDNTPPTIHNLPPDLCTSVVPPVPDNVYATDDCGGEVSLVYQGEQNKECFAGGTSIIRTWVARDQCGNVTRHQQFITYDDSFPPFLRVLHPDGSFIGKGDTVLLSADCNSGLDYALPELMVTVSDFCQSNLKPELTTELLATGNCQDDGFQSLVRVTYSATDNCGNTGSFSFVAKLIDDQAPVFFAGSLDQEVACDGPLPLPQVQDCDPSVTLTLLESVPAGGFCETGVDSIRRIWEASDACGNTSTAEQVLHLTSEPTTLISEKAMPAKQPLTPATDQKDAYKKAFEIFPNPSNKQVFFDLKDYAGEQGQLRIYNLMGQVVYQQKWEAIPGEPLPVLLDEMGDGLYTASLLVKGKAVQQKKFLVSK